MNSGITRWFVYFAIYLAPFYLWSQTPFSRHCNSQQWQEKPGFEQIFKNNQVAIQSYLDGEPLQSRQTGFIPLVFHIVLQEGQDSIPLEKILDQIEVLNECFNGQNHDLSRLDPDFRKFTSYTGPRFCLGSQNIDGEEIPGIETWFTDIQFIGDALNTEGKPIIKYTNLGGSDAWNPDQYINIWIGDLDFAQGKSTFPNTTNKTERGIIIDPDYFGVHAADSAFYPFHLGKTLVHEMGHFFNLKHPWGDEESCNSDDGIEDTPLQELIYFGCPKGKQYSCGSADMYMNFMNFTDDQCLVHFTRDQMQQINAAITLFYPGLLTENNCYSNTENIDPLESIDIRYLPDSRRLLFSFGSAIHEKVEISIFQLDGKKIISETIFHETKEEIQLNLVPAGIYVLFLRTENNFSSQKLFVY